MNNILNPFLLNSNGLRSVMKFSILGFILLIFSCSSDNHTISSVLESGATPSKQLKIKEETNVNFDKGVYFGFLDSEGILWFGSNGNGLYRYDGAAFTQYKEEDAVGGNQVLSIIEDNDDQLWFGTADGLWKYDREVFTHVPIPFNDTTSVWLDKVYPIINPNAVHSLSLDTKGNLWIGTGGAGAFRYDGENFTSFLSDGGRRQEDSLHHNWITSIIEDDRGNIWFSSMTRGGASRYNGENFRLFMPEDGLHTDMVRTIFKDKSGTIWFGYKATNDGGLTRYDGKYFVNYDKKDGLENHSIRTIYEDKKGDLWLGGDLNNLSIYDGENFEEFESPNDKKFEGILTILEDAKGDIWFGGADGLWRFDGETVSDMTKS